MASLTLHTGKLLAADWPRAPFLGRQRYDSSLKGSLLDWTRDEGRGKDLRLLPGSWGWGRAGPGVFTAVQSIPWDIYALGFYFIYFF